MHSTCPVYTYTTCQKCGVSKNFFKENNALFSFCGNIWLNVVVTYQNINEIFHHITVFTETQTQTLGQNVIKKWLTLYLFY